LLILEPVRKKVRYFYDVDFARWENLERLNLIASNQLDLLDAYRKLKAVTPHMLGMTACETEGESVYLAI